jgi:UDP-2-acetamido-3-amino-2,3-dideoxy-glucuronate N-acetyltransferase
MSEDAQAGVRVIPFAVNTDRRGSLVSGECPDTLPFTPARFFIVSNVPAGEIRGGHAHRTCHQLLVCVQGHIEVVVTHSDGSTSLFALTSEQQGLHIPPLNWAHQIYTTTDAQLLVLASEAYEPNEYIREIGELREIELH